MARDLRRYMRQTTFRLIVGGLVLLFIVGVGLIYFIYGPTSAISSIICLAAAMVPVGLIILILWVMDWIVKRADRD